MKKRNLFIAALLVAAATTVAVVSCKKENQDALLNNTQPAKAFTPPVVDDMNAYLKDFKQKMKDSQGSKDGETLSLEEAAWHLSSVANYDFARVNVQYTDLRYDTLYYQVNVANGQVALSDLNTIYESMANDIDAFYQSLDLYEKHFRFIGANITADGVISVSLITSSFTPQRYWGDTTWFFESQEEAELFCDDFFDESLNYPANGFGMTEIERALNLIESHPFEQSHEGRVYYTYTRTVGFYFDDYIDPFGSPFYHNSRLLATIGYFYVCMSMEDLCYCVDSYAGLGYGECQESESPVHWYLEFRETGRKERVGYHHMTVKYGNVIVSQEQNEY